MLVSVNSRLWQGRPVLVTGHTGFKGGWLTLWLHGLGARVHGYSNEPPTDPNLFEAATIKPLLSSDSRADLSDLAKVRSAFRDASPEVVFHLAAQPLVRQSYKDPLGTLATNVLGTAHVLEAARSVESVRAIVIITTDKVYENHESNRPYGESAPLGGHDPYSASKAAAEIVTASYRASFFSGDTGHPARIATARAGNVLGGGDWAADRLVPDCMRAFSRGEPVELRRPASVRPWQHVLEPIAGYLQLAEKLLGPEGANFARAWNFGPEVGGDASVGDLADLLARLWGNGAKVVRLPSEQGPHEAGLLKLDSSLARAELGWRPRWSLQQALEHTVSWQREWAGGADMNAFSVQQIRGYAAGMHA